MLQNLTVTSWLNGFWMFWWRLVLTISRKTVLAHWGVQNEIVRLLHVNSRLRKAEKEVQRPFVAWRSPVPEDRLPVCQVGFPTYGFNLCSLPKMILSGVRTKRNRSRWRARVRFSLTSRSLKDPLILTKMHRKVNHFLSFTGHRTGFGCFLYCPADQQYLPIEKGGGEQLLEGVQVLC